MKKKDQILLEETYQTVVKNIYQPKHLINEWGSNIDWDDVMDYYTRKKETYGAYDYLIADKFVPGNYDEMREILKRIADAERRNLPKYDDKKLDNMAHHVQREIEKIKREREEARVNKLNTEINEFDGAEQLNTRKKLEAAGYKRLSGEEYVDRDKDGRRILSLYYGKTIGSLLSRSREESVVRVNPNGTIGKNGQPVDDYLQIGRGKRFAQGKKSFF